MKIEIEIEDTTVTSLKSVAEEERSSAVEECNAMLKIMREVSKLKIKSRKMVCRMLLSQFEEVIKENLDDKKSVVDLLKQIQKAIAQKETK